jgi:hypothetical protein
MKSELKLKYNDINTDCTDNGTTLRSSGVTRRFTKNSQSSPKVNEDDQNLSSVGVHGGLENNE